MSQSYRRIEWCLNKAKKELEECRRLNKRPKHKGLIKSEPNNEEAQNHLWRIRLIMLPFIRILQTENLGQRAIQLSKFSVSALWIVNNKDNKVLLAKRAFTKKQHPGKWGTAVAGTVEEGESYESNIIKEAEEELGIRNIKPEKAIKEFVTGKHKHFTQWFFLKSDIELDELKVNADEVAEVGWFSMEEFLDLIKNNLAVTLTKELLQRIRTIND